MLKIWKIIYGKMIGKNLMKSNKDNDKYIFIQGCY